MRDQTERRWLWPKPLGAELPLRQLGSALAAGLLTSVSGVGLLATSGWLITRASERPPVFALAVAIGGVQAFALGRGVARYFERLGLHSAALCLLGSLRLRLYETLEPLVPAGLKDKGSGRLMTALVSDSELVADGFAKKTTAAIDVTSSVWFGVVLSLLIRPELAALLLGAAILTVLASLFFVALGRKTAKTEAETRDELADLVVDTWRAAPELVAYGREDLLARQLSTARERSRGIAWRQGLTVGSAKAVGTVLAGSGLMAIVALGLAAQSAGGLSGVMLAVAVFTALAVFDQLASLATSLVELQGARVAAARLDELSSLEPPALEPLLDKSPAPGPVRVELSRAAVSIGENPVLRGVSLAAEPGDRLGLLGANGAGKTTVLHALLHFVSVRSGRAEIGGTDVGSMSRPGLARHLGWLPEESYVFSASLADNLRLANPDSGPEALLQALEEVGLGSWYASLPEGLSTMLGAGGRALSAGERQRLGMARLLLGETRVLLLDEPTAHLDAASSSSTLSSLLEGAAGRSVIVVTHDPTVALGVDRVVALQNGQVRSGA